MTALNASVYLPGMHAHSSPTDQLVMYVYASCNCTDWRNVQSLATNIRMLPAFRPYVRVFEVTEHIKSNVLLLYLKQRTQVFIVDTE